MVDASDRHRVVVVGGGFGGLFAARALGRAPVDVMLIDRTNHHLFQPLLYQVSTGVLSAGSIAPPLRHLLRKHKGTQVELAEVTGFDLEERTVQARRLDTTPLTFPYDTIIVSGGAGTSYFGHDEFAEHAPGMKTIDDALNLRRRIFSAFELAESESDPELKQAWMTFVVVGGGPTGVEIAGQIAELARRTLAGEFRTIDPAAATVLLFEGDDEILAKFGDRLSGRATTALEEKGVRVHPGTHVGGVDAHGVDVKTPDGEKRIPARTVVWGAGVQASPLARMLGEATGAEVDRAGRVAVAPDCTLPGHPEVFAIGDMMTLDRLPGVAEVAMQQGVYAARTIKRRVEGKGQLGPFRYRDLGSMAMIGKGHAVVSFKGIRLSGRLRFLTWMMVHLLFLTGFRNRVRAFFSWTNSFIRKGRAERTITTHAVSGVAFYTDEESVKTGAVLGDQRRGAASDNGS